MIQRTVVASKRSSVDQRLASGVGTLGTEYAALLKSGRDELASLPNNVVMQKAIVTDDRPTVKRLADLASRGGLVIHTTRAVKFRRSEVAPHHSRDTQTCAVKRSLRLSNELSFPTTARPEPIEHDSISEQTRAGHSARVTCYHRRTANPLHILR